MPKLTTPLIAAGTVSGTAQPVLSTVAGRTLRPPEDADAAFILAAFADHEVSRWYARTIDDLAEARAWAERSRRRWREENGAVWTIEEAGGTPLGQAGLIRLDLGEGTAQFTAWTVAAARGRDVFADAARAVNRWALEDLGLERIECLHSTASPASCFGVTSAGFAFEGLLRSKARFADGRHDMHVHAVVRTEGEANG
ncbi:MAG TPA: GNAT family N-acetyltransferase [Actinospica sp.]|nr:GNAT family N-acetyltransferase [Actinospica sp.]